MKVVILAGGFGTRLKEITEIKPKPLVEIGEHPILWHIMKSYAANGFSEFVIALGYKGEVIKDYFINYRCHNNNLIISLKNGEIKIENERCEDWVIHLLDTGIETQTGGRIKLAADYIGNEPFMLTYGDGVSNVEIEKLLKFHHENKKLVTVTAVHPPARFGEIALDGNLVTYFKEKPQIGEGWINGGFFVLNPGATKYINDLSTIWESEPLETLAADKQLAVYKHEGFWQCMDTFRDVKLLEKLWGEKCAPWKIWK